MDRSTNTTGSSMTLEEARATMWFRSYSRPIGELLDKGYINRDKLEWAARNAYDPKIRQAAAVILRSMQQVAPAPAVKATTVSPPVKVQPQTIQVEMTVEQARAILWPFEPFKGQPMGSLLDARQLTFKDLGYAIDKAWDKRVKQAAIVLMAVRLDQAVKEPAPPAGLLKVISGGKSFAERKQFQLIFLEGLILGAMLSPLVLSLMQSFIRPAPPRAGKSLGEMLAEPVGVVALITAIALVVGGLWFFNYSLRWMAKQFDRAIDNYRKGQEGEDRVVEAMRQSLDGNWTLFRNVTLPGRNKADIDAVLVGPPGVWVLEIKTRSGEHRNIGEHWEIRSGNKWKPLKSFSRQAQDNAVRLSNFLKAEGIRQWVTPVVVWANRQSPLSVENPSVAVWTFDRLPEELGNIWQGQTVSESDRARIVEKLTALCQKKGYQE